MASSSRNTAQSSTPPQNAKIAKAYPSLIGTNAIPNHYVVALFLIRILSAIFNPISDCDETFGYWEPSSFLITNYGFQTWEYAPQFALRSYSYLLQYESIGKILSFLPITISRPYIIFYFLRVFLSITCALCELYFARSLVPWFGRLTSQYTLLFMTFSSGMFNCGAAYLPQQFVLCAMCLSFGSLFRENRKMAILWMGIAVLIGWPFIVALAVPMALDCILMMGFLSFCGWTLLFGLSLCSISILIDYVFYGKLLLAPLNIFLYNMAFTGSNSNDDDGENGGDGGGGRVEGQNLYGTEDWTFYVKNLVFNWNIVFILALLAPIACNVVTLMFCNMNQIKKEHNNNNNTTSSTYLNGKVAVRLLHCMLPFWSWYLFFTYMPHKEERFMFVIYPFIALNASLSVTQCGLIKVGDDGVSIMGFHLFRKGTARMMASALRMGILLVFFVVSLSRTAGQVMYYRAPLVIWSKAGDYIRAESNNVDGKYGMKKVICVGKEWHRVPSSLFVSDVASIKWIDAGFDGQLPAEFEATNVVNLPFNDRNEGDKTRFVQDVDNVCDYIIDLWEADTVITEYERNHYMKIESAPFLDRAATGSGIFRSFYIPYLSDSKVQFGEYVFLKRKQSDENQSA